MRVSILSSNRLYPDHPFVGVSALIRHEDFIVLVSRSNPPSPIIWSLPGGAVETGETLIEAVKREIAEEVGVEFIPTRLSEVVEVILRDEDERCSRHFVINVFSGSVPLSKESRPPLTAGDDAGHARWVSLNDLEDYTLTDGTLDVIRRILADTHLTHMQL